MIINKSAILYAGKKYDITQDVLNGLNKRYKRGSATADKKKDEK
jgi:outer membrane protein